MILQHPLMKKWLGVVALLLLASCTKSNPKSCADGACTDPMYPFCDIDGTLGGEPQECIAVACTPDEFASCRGDQEVRCNVMGNNYDVVQCELGCNAATNGCKLCEPNETRCTNGAVATCDAAGDVVSTEPCPLGCFDNQPRCRRIDPSNNLAMYLDMVPVGPDLVFSNAEFEVDTGIVRVGGQMVSVPGFSVLPSGNGVPIRVYVVNSIDLNSATFSVTGDPRELPKAAVAFVSHGDVTIRGEVLIQSRVGGAVQGCTAGKGVVLVDASGRGVIAGGGGGGNATDGGAGGRCGDPSVMGAAGGVKGAAGGTPALVPLRGGCPGGFVDVSVNGTYHNGGGAIQISSETKIEIDATIDVRGQAGESDYAGVRNAVSTGGGGAGGSILLEAPSVTLGPFAKLLATGGDGAQGCAIPTTTCGMRGVGGTSSSSATSGADVPYPALDSDSMGGGGGGALGRVRVNTKSGMYSKSSAAVEDAAITTGVVGTR